LFEVLCFVDVIACISNWPAIRSVGNVKIIYSKSVLGPTKIAGLEWWPVL
jgi:hypothetical protein